MVCACRIQKLKQVLALPVPSHGTDPQKAKVGKIKVHETQSRKRLRDQLVYPAHLVRCN